MLLKTSIKWGLLLGLALAVTTQLLTWLGLGLTNWFVVVTYLLAILFIYLVLRTLNQEQGKLTFLHAALAVVVLIFISRLIFQSYMFIYIHYIDPSWVDTVAATWAKSMQEAGLSPDTIAQQINSFRKLNEPSSMFTIGLILYAIPQLFIGLILSAIFVFSPFNYSRQA